MELEPEEEEFLPTVTSAASREGEDEGRLSPDSPKRRGGYFAQFVPRVNWIEGDIWLILWLKSIKNHLQISRRGSIVLHTVFKAKIVV